MKNRIIISKKDLDKLINDPMVRMFELAHRMQFGRMSPEELQADIKATNIYLQTGGAKEDLIPALKKIHPNISNERLEILKKFIEDFKI